MSKFSALALEVDRPGRMTIVDPVSRQPLRDREGKEAYIDLYSSDSEVARKHNRAVQRRRLAMRGRGKLTPEEIEAEAVELLVALSTGWYLLELAVTVEHKIEHELVDGKQIEKQIEIKFHKPIDIPFSPENARELYEERAMLWLRESVDEYSADRGNFSKASPKT